MARKSGAGPSQSSPKEPVLAVALSEAHATIQERISGGENLLAQVQSITQVSEVVDLRSAMYTWHEYNQTLLRRILGPQIDEEYQSPISFGGSSDPGQQLEELQEDLKFYLRRLGSIDGRLELWQGAESSQGDEPSNSVTDGPIFIVHGADLSRANEVARIIERSTRRDAVILHEQPNAGRTLLEKFESHAQKASYAVVVLTSDDEGRRQGDDAITARGRQNVIFEMGFFFAKLGRRQTAVLVDSGVERPSDVDGLVYIDLAMGDWKQQLMREVAAAGIDVEFTRIP